MNPLIVVEEAFRISNRGVVLAPAIPSARIRKRAAVQLRLVFPDGTDAIERGNIWREHLRLASGGSRSDWVVVLGEVAEKPPAGTAVFVEACDPADALVE